MVVAFSDAAGNTFTVPMSVVVAGSGTGSGIGALIPSLAATGANTWLVMSGGLIALLAGGVDDAKSSAGSSRKSLRQVHVVSFCPDSSEAI